MEISRVNSALTSPINYTLLTTTNAVAPKIIPDAIPLPEGMPIRRRVQAEFGIEVLDTDVKFVTIELLVIEETLKDYTKKKRKHHLNGVKQIVKNREARVKLMKAFLNASGAYDPENMRIFLFDNLKPQEIPTVLVHEIGHAVNNHNINVDQFMDFIALNGYTMHEFRKTFNNENAYYQISLKKVEVPFEEWGAITERFSMKSLMKNQDVFGEIILDLGRHKEHPWDENPHERFAWAYEWFINKKEEFLESAEKYSEEGDNTLQYAYDYMEKVIFNEN